MRKIFQLEDRFPTGEPTVQLVLTSNGRGGRLLEKRAFDSSSDAYAYLTTVTPKQGHSIVLVNAMGAYETYDDNRNGDSFPARAVNVGKKASCGHKECLEAAAWITEAETLPNHYKTFEKHGGIFKHHRNNDPTKSLGSVLKAVWNVRMQRVELLLEIVNDRDPELVKRIADHESLAVSMGCKVPWDVCSICGHRAPTRKDYCEHARMKMRQVLASGEKVCVHNPSPRFFDISFVYRPADPTGFMLKKVANSGPAWEGYSAEAGEVAEAYEQKIADERKLSDIRKQLLGRVSAERVNKDIQKYKNVARQNAKNRKPAKDEELDKLSQYPLSVIASTFAAKNAALSAGDVTRLFLKRAGMTSPDWLVDRVVAMQPVFDALCCYDPSIREKTSSLIELHDRHVNPALFPLVQAWVEKHAGLTDYVRDSLYEPSSVLPTLSVGPGALYRASEPGRTDLLTMTDPVTGHVYQTTRGAARAAHHANMKHKLFGAGILSAGYMAGLHKLLNPKVPWWIKAPVAIAAGLKTYEGGQALARPFRNPEYLTDQGILVPGSTEFAKVSALTLPTYLDKVAFDVIERVGDQADPLLAIRQKVAAYAPKAAISRFLVSAEPDTEKAAALARGIEYDSDPLQPPQIDLDALSERVGALLLS